MLDKHAHPSLPRPPADRLHQWHLPLRRWLPPGRADLGPHGPPAREARGDLGLGRRGRSRDRELRRPVEDRDRGRRRQVDAQTRRPRRFGRTAHADRHRQGRTQARGAGRPRRRSLARLRPVQHGDDRAIVQPLPDRAGARQVAAHPALSRVLDPCHLSRRRRQRALAGVLARNRRRFFRDALLLRPRDPPRSRRAGRTDQHFRRRHAHRILGRRRDAVVRPGDEGEL